MMESNHLEYLKKNLDIVKQQITEDFTTLNFTDGRHPKERIDYVDDDDIETEVVSVEINDASVVSHDRDSIHFKMDAEVSFRASLSFLNLDTQYYDDDDGEYKTLDTTTLKIKPQSCVIPVEVVLNLEEDEVIEIDSVNLRVKEPIGVIW